MKACQWNNEGIKHFKEVQSNGEKSWDVEHCQESCENHGRCVAVDWFPETRICLMYSDACTTPLTDHDGSYSLRVFRADLIPPKGKETAVPSKGGNNKHDHNQL